jgi:Transposase DDE domain/Domain of unknown function (DUF4372)
MLFCHLGRAQSLREIRGGLAASEGKLRHLGLPDAPKRSTLAYANEHRSWPLYQRVLSTTGPLPRNGGLAWFPFQKQAAHSGRHAHWTLCFGFRLGAVPAHQGAVKLPLLLDHQGLLPSFALITEGRVHESRVAPSLRFEPGTIVGFDRGYADYDWFASLDADGVFFVTRMKDNADYGVVERRSVPFVGTSPNTLQIQIWTALIALLLLKYLQMRARFGSILSNLAALLRQQLFVYRDLFVWIDQPFQLPLCSIPPPSN